MAERVIKTDYIDKEYLALKRKAQKDQYNSFDTGFLICEDIVQFDRLEIPEMKVSIMQPTSFVNMPSSIARAKYPSESRPKLIRTSLDTIVNFTFNVLPQAVRYEKVRSVTEQLKAMIQRLNPANVFYELREEKIDGVPLCWFNYKTYAIDSQLYAIVYLFPLSEGEILQGMFSCRFDDMNEWHDAAIQTILSIRKLDGQKE